MSSLFLRVAVLAAICHTLLPAQTIDDATMIPSRSLFAGYLYSYDSWDQYWEGQLKRTNGNLGTVSTQMSKVYADYGLSDHINIIATLPYVWTNASQGVLASQSGWQDFTIAAKIRVFTKKVGGLGSLSLFGAGTYTIPTRNYTPDFMPLSIGSDSITRGLRSTVNFESKIGLFVTGSGQYTWRDDVTLDRGYYFTNNQFFYTSDVPLPNVIDYEASAGFTKKRRMAKFNFDKVITQGGVTSGDIRRQDFPFVSNRVISSRIGATIMYPVPFVHDVDFRFEYSHVTDGRNAGQSDTYTLGLFKTISFKRTKKS